MSYPKPLRMNCGFTLSLRPHKPSLSPLIPPCVTIAINATQKRKTLRDMLETKAFVLGFPSIFQVKEAD